MNLMQKLEHLNTVAQQHKELTIDGEQWKRAWISQVYKLYDDIEQWLQEYHKKGYVKFQRQENVTITEEHIGTYAVNVLEARLGEPTLIFEPVGADVIGASGRIDVFFRGQRDSKIILLLVSQDSESHWEFLPPRWIRHANFDEYLGEKSLFYPRERNIVFNKNTLERLLDEWIEIWSLMNLE